MQSNVPTAWPDQKHSYYNKKDVDVSDVNWVDVWTQIGDSAETAKMFAALVRGTMSYVTIRRGCGLIRITLAIVKSV